MFHCRGFEKCSRSLVSSARISLTCHLASPDRNGNDFSQIVIFLALLFFLYSDPHIYLSSEEVLRKSFGLFNVLSTTTSQWTAHENITPRKSVDLSLVFYREISLVREINLVFHFYLKE